MSNFKFSNEFAHVLHGVEGRMFNRIIDGATGLFLSQTFSASRPFKRAGYKAGTEITVHVSYDDECKNGKQSFAITGDVREPGARDVDMCGCIHEEIAKYFPELAHLIQWHLFDAFSPLHYVSNTCYHARERDHSGLLKGEERQIIDGKTGLPSWRLVALDANGETVPTYKLDKYLNAATKPECAYVLEWQPWVKTGEGKARDLNAARESAAWPDATDAELSVPRAELETALLARLPALMERFHADMAACTFLEKQTPDQVESARVTMGSN